MKIRFHHLTLAGCLLILATPLIIGQGCDTTVPTTPEPDQVLPDPPPTPPETPQSVSVTGKLTVGDSLTVDLDTLDAGAAGIGNDGGGLTDVQLIPSPSTVGGFLGDLGSRVDINDVYLVELAAGQKVSLVVWDPEKDDFDLFLYDLDGEVLDSSETTGIVEQLTAPATGSFLVEVHDFLEGTAATPYGVYTLLIGSDPTAQGLTFDARQGLSSLNPFVDGEVLLKTRPGKAGAGRLAPAAAMGMAVLNDGSHSGGTQRLLLPAHRRVAAAAPAGRFLHRPASPTIAAIKELRRRPEVAFAQPNYIRQARATPTDPLYARQWHYGLINLPTAWDVTTGSPDVIVAVIDTGVVLKHPDLQAQLVDGYDFISSPSIANDGDGIDANPDDSGDSSSPGEQNTYHGTHVSGTIAAATNNGVGIAGVAWGAKIMPLRALGVGGGTDYDVAQCIRFAAGLDNDSDTVPDESADVINMSLGGPGYSQVQQDAITDARNVGLVIVTAAGNEASNGDNDSPGGLDGVVNVSAVGPTKAAAPYSNYGNSVSVAAPGGDMSKDIDHDGFLDGVLSTVGNQGNGLYDYYQGTSMAAPHVAGVVALMKSVNPELTPLDVDQLLAGVREGTTVRITEDLGTAGKDQVFGHGLINAALAVQAAAEIAGIPVTLPPVLQVSPSSLVFDTDDETKNVLVTNGGGDTLVVDAILSSQGWMTVSPQPAGAGTYTLTVDRSGLNDGVHVASVTFQSGVQQSVVSVRVYVGDLQAVGGTIGTIYVTLSDPGTLQTVAETQATPQSDYAFAFNDVPAGKYLMSAGSDLDGDGIIGNDGEAYGAYPTVAFPALIDARLNVSGVRFQVGYLISPAVFEQD